MANHFLIVFTDFYSGRCCQGSSNCCKSHMPLS